jgi:hypothetical protein
VAGFEGRRLVRLVLAVVARTCDTAARRGASAQEPEPSDESEGLLAALRPRRHAPLASARARVASRQAATKHSGPQWNVLNWMDWSVAGAPGCTVHTPELRTRLPDLTHRQRSRWPSTGHSSLASSVVQLASARRSST